jgi:hypothetical protein
MRIVFFVIMIAALAGALLAEKSFKYDAKDKRDPFIPLVSEEGVFASDAYGISGIKDVRLEGIVWDEEKGSAAIINGEIFKEGQETGTVKILKIDRDGVIFDVNGEEVTIKLVND